MNTFIFNCGIIVLCTTHMMACSIVTGHVTAILCRSAELLTTISTPPSLDNRFCPNIAIASFLLIIFPTIPLNFFHQYLGQIQRADRKVCLSAGCHPTLIGRDFPSPRGISAAQKDYPFILRARKYELRGAEPFILCRALVPIMTVAYYFTLPMDGNCNSFYQKHLRQPCKKTGPSLHQVHNNSFTKQVINSWILIVFSCFRHLLKTTNKLCQFCAEGKVRRFSSYIVLITVKTRPVLVPHIVWLGSF